VIANAVIGCFSSLTGNTEDDTEKLKNILRSRLIEFASDGASEMVGEYKGTVVKLQEMLNTNFKAFHCLAHRLELVVPRDSSFLSTCCTLSITGHTRM